MCKSHAINQCVPFQIEDLSQQAQMAAAEKFKASEPTFAERTAKPVAEIPALEEESDEEVSDMDPLRLCVFCVIFCG